MTDTLGIAGIEIVVDAAILGKLEDLGDIDAQRLVGFTAVIKAAEATHLLLECFSQRVAARFRWGGRVKVTAARQ